MSNNIAQVVDALSKQLIGHDRLINRLLISLLAGGHLLIEGPPGLAKTRAINRFAELINARFVRIQSTPDLLPADITGTDVFRQNTGEFQFREGPLFNNIVLVDEVNRAPPKVQSALLEAMGEGQISSGGTTRQLSQPFMVAATQNPIEHEGTYPLPEAQLDRFMFFVEVTMPDAHNERKILDTVLSEMGINNAQQPLVSLQDITLVQEQVRSVHISDAVRDYIVRLVAATRGQGIAANAAESIIMPASPRASIFLAQASQAQAYLQGRDYVSPEDVELLAGDIISGRVALSYQARAEGVSTRLVIDKIVQATPKL